MTGTTGSKIGPMGKPVLTVGLIGYQFMGKAHSNAYRQAGRYFDLPVEVRMKTLCGRTGPAVKAAAENLGWEGHETNWRTLLEDPEIDIVDIATPGNCHSEMCCAAADAGKIVFCEKPIGNTLAEAKMIAEAVRKSGKPSAVFHNYRKSPAVAQAKRMVEQGMIGTPYHIRATYLQDWIADPGFPLVWRLEKDKAGSGTLGDIGSHMIDMARHLLGEFQEVNGLLHTFVNQRPKLGDSVGGLAAGSASTEMGEVTVDDASLWLARFKNGALGTFESTRFAVGRKNFFTVEINGSRGAIRFDQERMNELEYYDASDTEGVQGFRRIQATESCHPYAGQYWPVGHIIGYEHTFINLVADALTAIHKGEQPSPDIEDGLANQKVLDAVERSHETRSWVAL